MKVYVCDFFGDWALMLVVAISLLPNNHMFKTHVVAGKCPGFI
jgi:hypothetical protein